ncbi:hypothetical protein [Microbacterium sp.]|uniref:hypothetical protein n=1 Tax=Microbacterium sp. TaxID=51671 RepID=UPI0039E4362A
MSSTGTPTGSVLPAAARNPLGRVALIVAIVQVLGGLAWTIIQPTVIAQAAAAALATPTDPSNPMPPGLATQGMITTGVNIALFVLALVALILGIVACRRSGLPRLGGAIAIGVGGAAVAGYAGLLIGSLVLTLTLAGSVTP